MTPSTDPIDGKPCLVTGGAGFLGSYLVRALKQRGCPVHVLDVVGAPSEQVGVRWFVGDVQNEADVHRAMEGADTVFHTAALIEAFRYAPTAFSKRVRGVNVEGTRNVVRAAQRLQVRRLIQTSSIITAFGQQSAGGDEDGPYSTAPDLYSSTKVEAERLVLEANGKGGLLTCAIRPGGIYGPGERATFIGPLIRGLKLGSPLIVFGDGSARLDYVYIDSLVDAQLRAAERLVEGSPVCGQAYFVSDESPINAGEFSIQLVREMGLKSKPVRIPGSVARAVATVCERSFQLFGRPKPPFSIANVVLCDVDNYFCIDKAKRDLDYAPLVDFDEGLRRTAVDARAYYDSL